ncbi:hypothetical protein KP509_17G031600 [Ceratopteris richardii]|uniref:DUF4378 domain-containing protein n=1 Tax=Ceratopteris richardii TaxID=49495 RepID=A0A8T2SX58_CERRI|nr:hypothetical protein KP509_17G031600 [Ceratopteris richardii]
MADTPGKVLSSFADSNDPGRNFNLGGCASIFSQIFDRFNSRKFSMHKLLPSERYHHNIISHAERKLPMAKLLLIADEKRIACTGNEEDFSSKASQQVENYEVLKKMPVSIVARLMGLETMPCKASTANVQVLELRTEDQSAKQLLQFGKISEEKAEKDVRVMDTIIHTSNRTTDSFNTRDSFEMGMTDSDSVNTSAFEHPLAKCESNAELKSCETTAHANSNKGKYSEDFILSDFPASEILLEPIFRSSVSHSSDSAVLLSPSNASLSLKSTVQSFEEPVEVLEPNLCSSKDVGSSAVLHALCRDHGEDDRKHDAGLLRSQPSPDSSLMSMDHGLNLMPADYKGKDTSRCSNLFALKAKQFSKSAMQTKHIDYKEQAKDIHTIVKHKKGVNNMESIDKKLSTSDSCKQETNTSKNGECKSLHSTKFRKTSVESVKTSREQDKLVTISETNPERQASPTVLKLPSINDASPLKKSENYRNHLTTQHAGSGERILLGLLRKLILSTHASPLRSSCAEQDVSYQDMFSKGLEAVCNITSGYKGGFSLPSEYIQNSTSNIESIEQHSKWQGSPSAREEDSSQDSGSVSGSFCAEECEQPSPISILESPFEDSASSSPDGCGALQGTKALDTAADEAFDSMIRDRVQVEDIRRRKNFKGSLHRKACPYCMDSEGMDGGVQSSALSENEDGYVRQILDAAILPIVSTLWEKLAYSGPSIDPLVYGQFEEHLHQHKEVMYINLCKEIKCRSNNCSSTACRACIMSCHEAATQRRRLLFDCIGAALKSSLELAVQSYGCLVPYIHPCPGYFAEAVYMHLIRWMRFSSNTNLNDMVKAEVNEGMGRWFMFHDEVDNLAATVEAMILKGLIDELSKDSFM